MTITFRSQRDMMRDCRDVMIVDVRGDGTRFRAAPLIFESMESGLLHDPTIGAGAVDGDEFLQAALDHAWEIGLRPRGFNDTTQQVTAIKDHLADMRALVFAKVKNK